MLSAPLLQNPLLYTTKIDVSGSFIFNWLDLSDCWELSLDTSNHDDINQVDLDVYNAPRIDWGWVLGFFVRWKTLNLKMIIMEDTAEELNDMIDYLKLKLFKKEWILRIKVNDKYRQIKASLTNLNFNRDFEKPTILSNVQISFRAMENFHDEDTTYYTETWITTPTLAMDINNVWFRVDYQLYFIFGSGIVWTDTFVIEQDWYTLTVNQAVSDWDILIIDWIEKQVLYNWVPIDYDWPFTQLENWSNPILININWTYVADITALYYRNYL